MKMKAYTLGASLALLLAACATTPQPAATGDDNIQLETNVFAIKGQDTLRLDTYIDYTQPAPAEGRPVIIYIHGGGFTMGSRINAAQEIFCRHMAKEGFVAVSVDYRLAGMLNNADDGTVINPYGVQSVRESVTIACEDVVDATCFVLQQPAWQVNPAQVSLAGGSAGAITTLTLVYDRCNGADYTQSLPEGFAYAGAISQAGAVGTLEPELVWKSTPCPMMFFHGTIDELVPRGKADIAGTNFMGTEYIAAQLKEMGIPHWVWLEPGADHVLAMKPCTQYLEEQARFLKDFVSGKQQATVYTEWTQPEPDGMQSIEEMVQSVPMYVLGYEKYLKDIDWNNLGIPEDVVY